MYLMIHLSLMQLCNGTDLSGGGGQEAPWRATWLTSGQAEEATQGLPQATQKSLMSESVLFALVNIKDS